MRTTESTILWILFWIVLLTMGNPDILDKIVDLLGALVKHFGG